MCNALLRVDADIVAEWFVAGKSTQDVKSLLKLPERFEVQDVTMDATGLHVVVTVNVPELPENAAKVSMPELEATLGKTQDEDGQWHLPDTYELKSLKATIALPMESEVQ